MTRIAMIAGPRNISTTMMRAFENRPDTHVIDEPFYAHYLAMTGVDHPMREDVLRSLPTAWADVLAALSAPLPDGVDYQFEKHIAYHFAKDTDRRWLSNRRVFCLIRNPAEMVASFAKKYRDVAPIIESLRWQRDLVEQCDDKHIPIIDAADILRDPAKMLKALCAALEIPFSENMLTWPAGRRSSDGVWGAHWYDAVEQSTGFKPYAPRDVALSPDLEALVAACRSDYAFLHARRLGRD